MDLNIPGTDAWGLALGKPNKMLMSQLRPEKQALDIINAKAGRLTSTGSVKPQDEQIREAAQEFVASRDDFVIETPPFAFNEGAVERPVTYWPEAYLRRIRP